MLQRIEFIHEKGFIHRDIKPENFVVGLNEKSSMVHIIDFGLSKRYKDKNTGQHIPYRENRHLVGTARYASINAHLGIEQSRRDDIESIGYVLVYLILGRLPWQSKQEKGKQPAKIMEKKLITPPEILCKKLPLEFSYYFHYCKNLKYEDRPDYATLKSLFYDLLMQQENVSVGFPEFTLDWFEDDNVEYRRDEDGILISITKTKIKRSPALSLSLYWAQRRGLSKKNESKYYFVFINGFSLHCNDELLMGLESEEQKKTCKDYTKPLPVGH